MKHGTQILKGWFKTRDGSPADIEVSFYKGDSEIHINPFVVDEVFVENVSIGESLTTETLTAIEEEINNMIKLEEQDAIQESKNF